MADASPMRADVIVVGAGPAGLAAAHAAATDGARVVVVDENPETGGQIWRASHRAPHPRARALLAQLERDGVTTLRGTTVFDAVPPGSLRAVDAGGHSVALEAPAIVLATGATELLLPFPGWTLPGVFGAGGLQAMVKGGLDVAGRRVLLAGSGPLLLAVAAALRRSGARIVALVEQADRRAVRRLAGTLWNRPAKLGQAAALSVRLCGVPRHHATWPVRAHAGGDGWLRAVTLRGADGSETTLDVDLLGVGFGLAPATRLAQLLGCELDGDRVATDDLLRTSVPGVHCAGEAAGIGGVDCALVEGAIAGHSAARRDDLALRARRRLRRERGFAAALADAFALRPELRELPTSDTVVCRCEDVAYGALADHRDAHDAKLATRCGMGPCQGRICGPALRFLRDWAADRVRPPLVPVPMAALRETLATTDSTP
ncbi:MAG: FAD-dependent oxidoreductase [Planctomycetes bacterium]|nr:FAD-dependent oxidoreductase [Planctomycetota bacterium]